jgi:hypothetical protein
MTRLAITLAASVAMLAGSTFAQCGAGSGGAAAAVVGLRTPDMQHFPISRPRRAPRVAEEAPTLSVQEQAQWNREKDAALKLVRTVRHKHLNLRAAPQMRAQGLAQLQELTSMPQLVALVETLHGQGPDVDAWLIEHLSALNTPGAITALGYLAIDNDNASQRLHAADRLLSILNTPIKNEQGQEVDPPVPGQLISLMRNRIRGKDDLQAGNAARLASSLGLIELIPALIAGQLGGGGTGGRGGSGGDGTAIAWIQIGTQRAYVADLTPIVSEGAVGFDPTPGVVTDGVVLAIGDAAVVTYRLEVYEALVSLSTQALGESTAHVKPGYGPWANWYRDVYRPHMLAKTDGAVDGASALHELKQPARID